MYPHSTLITSLVLSALTVACGGKSAPNAGAGTTTTPTATGGDTWAAQKSGPIAPACTEAVCAEVELASNLACHDATSAVDFSLTTKISGKTTEVSCAGVKSATGALDLQIGVNPPGDAAGHGSNSVWFKLRNYKGPGTYALENLADDGDHMGLKLTGATTGHTERVLTVGTVACVPRACEAIVAEGSQPIPTDEMSTHEFRVRVEVRCPRGSEVGNMQCESGATRCKFAETPTFLADVVCRQ